MSHVLIETIIFPLRDVPGVLREQWNQIQNHVQCLWISDTEGQVVVAMDQIRYFPVKSNYEHLTSSDTGKMIGNSAFLTKRNMFCDQDETINHFLFDCPVRLLAEFYGV
jgi:hypothetical protein